MKVVTECLQLAFKKHDIRLYSKAGYTVRNAVVSAKDPFDKCEQCGVIYESSSEVCGKLYIGKTGRAFGEKVEEHATSLIRGGKNSALANIK